MRYRTYVVRWRDGLLKVGFTSGKRYRKFVNRGADLVCLQEFDTPMEALAEEQRLDLGFRVLGYTPAFTCREESFTHLGPGGSGWREVLRLACSVTDPSTDSAGGSVHGLPRTNERTDSRRRWSSMSAHDASVTRPAPSDAPSRFEESA